MKNILKFVAVGVLLVVLIVGATLIYNDYMEENKPSNIVIVGGKVDKPDASPGESSSMEMTTESEKESEDAIENTTGSDNETQNDTEPESVPAESQDTEDGTGDQETERVTETEPERVTEVETETETETETERVTETETESPYLAADFTVYDYSGKAVKLSDFRGKPIVLNFWASGCSPCRSEMPDFQKMYEKYGDQVVFLMVNYIGFFGETVESGHKFVTDNGYTFPVYFDTKYSAVSTYGINSIPQTFFIDRDFDLYTYIPGMASLESLETCIGWILE